MTPYWSPLLDPSCTYPSWTTSSTFVCPHDTPLHTTTLFLKCSTPKPRCLSLTNSAAIQICVFCCHAAHLLNTTVNNRTRCPFYMNPPCKTTVTERFDSTLRNSTRPTLSHIPLTHHRHRTRRTGQRRGSPSRRRARSSRRRWRRWPGGGRRLNSLRGWTS